MRTRHPILGLLAFALIMVVAGTAYASCTGSNRIDRDDAECLSGWWDNNSWPKKSTFGAQNLCPDWGKVVAKVDIKDAGDRTWHLADGDKRRSSTSNTVRDIYCCQDLGDKMCNKADRVSAASCKTQFEASPANDDCDMDSDPTVDGDVTCRIELTCSYTATDGTEYERQSILGVPWSLADDVDFCVEHTGIQPRMWLDSDGSC